MEKPKFPLQEIQKKINAQKQLGGWLIYDFRGQNPLGLELLGIDSKTLLSRRFFYWIPKQGSPLKIVHHIEAETLKHLPGDQIAYESWQSLELALKSTLRGQKCIAMEHSPMGQIPVLSKLDAGFYEWLQDKKIEVVSSWDLAKNFICTWDASQLKAHKEAAKFLLKVFEECYCLVHASISSRKKVTEYSLQQEILNLFAKHKLITDHAPIVACGPNSALPHYCPSVDKAQPITKEKPLLIDIWCKKNKAHATFADFTRTVYVGKIPPQEIIDAYDAVKRAQDAAIEHIQKSLKQGKEVLGCEVDDVCRKALQKHGFAKYFVHRTGHNIHTVLHGPGPNLDNFETQDSRNLIPRTCYSIEPGIYIPKAFGIRLECNIFIHDDLTVEVTGQCPDKIPCLF